MCVICASPAGARQPDISEIKRMFRRNPDGAGYMVARGGKIEIHKGFMYLNDYLSAIRQEHFTAKDSVVYHFRISTQAGINPAMTHPFPLSNQLGIMKALDVVCRCGVAHNGSIPLTDNPGEHEYSDTALFTAFYLSRMVTKPDDLKSPALLNRIAAMIQSRMVIMDGSGYIALIGPFFNDHGLLYSNLYHRD